MRGHELSETDAFALIRQTAMRHRTTIEQLSAEIIALGGMPKRTTRTAYVSCQRDLRTLHASRSHRAPCGIKRTGHIDSPASRLHNYAVEAEPARING